MIETVENNTKIIIIIIIIIKRIKNLDNTFLNRLTRPRLHNFHNFINHKSSQPLILNMTSSSLPIINDVTESVALRRKEEKG